MSIFDEQIKLFMSIKGLIDPNSVINIDGHEFITNSTVMAVIKSFYDVDIIDEPNNDIKMYISLKPAYKSCGFIDAFVGVGFYEVVCGFGLKDPDTIRKLQINYCLQEFSEVDLIEMLYLEAVDELKK